MWRAFARAVRTRPRRMLAEWLATGLAATALGLALLFGSAVAQLDNALYDAVMRLGEQPPRDDVLIVAIDDRSLEELGPWPWPRSVHAQLLERLTAAGPRAIGYDILFLESTSRKEDAALAGAVAHAGDVCLPVLIEQPGRDGAVSYVRRPTPPIGDGAAGLGHVVLPHDPDGVSRRAVLARLEGGEVLPHLMACAYRVGERKAPPTGELLIPYRGGSGHVRTASAVSVLRGETPEAFFRDAYVLVGVTAAGLHDRHATPMTPLGGAMPGVEVQANLLTALLAGGGVRTIPQAAQAAYVLIGVWLLMAALLALAPRRALPAGFALVVAVELATAGLHARLRVWAPPAAFVVAAAVAFPLWGWRRLAAANAYMRRELEAFAREPDLLPLVGDLRPGDGVDRHIQLLERTLRRVRDLRRFATDTLRSLPDPTFVAAPDGQILFANPAARRLVSPSATPHLQNLLNGWLTPEGGSISLPDPETAAESDMREVTAPDGRSFLAAVAPYRDSLGTFAAWIVRLTDITALKAAEAQREQIVHLLGHDMRSPQSSILALLETAGPDAVQPDVAGKLAAYARRTLTLADDMVQLARAGSDALQFELLDLSALVAEAMDELWPQAKRADVRLHLEDDGVEHVVSAERSLLTRALINLLDNAIKFSPPAGVVSCRLRRDGACVWLEISDQGPGIPAAQQEKLFTPFHRSGGAGGAGLGLTLVSQVVRRHEGDVSCRSTPGATTFVVALPLADQPAGGASA